MTLFVHLLAEFFFLGVTLAAVDTKRDLSTVRYRFTSCGASGRSGPSFSQCQEYYRVQGSLITEHDLLFEFGGRTRAYEGAQGFQVPVTGLYNVTVGAAGGGQGICNIEDGGYGFQRTVQVELTTDYELLILVGQRGAGPCDVIPENDDIYEAVCASPPTNTAEVLACNETWYNFTNAHSLYYRAIGGGAGGGGTLVRARNKITKEIDGFPIVIVGGGGGTASVLDYDVVEDIGAGHILLANHFAYRTFVNGESRIYDPDYGLVAGIRGSRIDSSSTVAGAGGGFGAGITQSISVDGESLGRPENLAEGGIDCIDAFSNIYYNVPYSGVYGGFGGGGGACGGGGAGGGYTGGAVLGVGVTVPGGGGFSYIGDSGATSFEVTPIGSGRLNNQREEGFVEIVLANCGCVYECSVNTTADRFECLCPDNTTLAQDLNDCYSDKDMAIIEEPEAVLTNGVYSKYIQLPNSTFILSNSIRLESDGKLCVLFWLGRDSEMTLATNVVRGMGTIHSIVVVEDGVLGKLVTMLNTSLMVTGALLVGTGDCTIAASTISIGESIRNTTIASVSIEMFRTGDNSLVQQQAEELAAMLFLQETPASSISTGAIAGILVTTLATIVGFLCLVICFGLMLKFKLRRKVDTTATSLPSSEKGDIIRLESTSNAYTYVKHDQACSSTTLQQIPRSDITLIRTIGNGEFGLVYSAEIISPLTGEKEVVAVKAIKDPLDKNGVDDLEKECRMMCGLHHPNVLTLIGVCIDGESPYIIMPLMERGSLLTYLKNDRANLLVEEDSKVMSARRRLLDMCYQIAKGMDYIARLGIVHRDLAARNCMIDKQGILRVSDFGLSESVYTKTYLRVENHREVKLPVKWAAPESISDGIFSEKTDIWSFGITCWEVFSAGKTPYPGIHALTVINMIEEGYRMDKPRNNACTDQLYTLMMNCWDADSKQRPLFTDVVQTLSSELDQLSDYVVVTIR